MDDTIRPKQARKVLDRTAALADASTASPIQPEPPEQPTGWRSLTHQDRLLFSLQKGADPTKPMSWTHVAEALNMPATISTTTSLQHQYANVYQHLRTYYAAAEEPTATYDQTLYYAEGFDLYNHNAGDKYWHHHNDNIVSHDSPAQTDGPAIGTTNEEPIAITEAAFKMPDEYSDDDKENHAPERKGLTIAWTSIHHPLGILATEGQNSTAVDGAADWRYRSAAGVDILLKSSIAEQFHPYTTITNNRSLHSQSTTRSLNGDETAGSKEQAYKEDKRRLVRSSPW